VNTSQADKKSIYEEAREATLRRAGASRDSIMLPLSSEIVSLFEQFFSVNGQGVSRYGREIDAVWHSNELFLVS